MAVVQFPCSPTNPYLAAVESLRRATSGTRLHFLAVTVRNTGSQTFDLAGFRLVTTSGQVQQLTPVARFIGGWISASTGFDQITYTAAADLQRALPVLVPPGTTVTSLVAAEGSVFNMTGVVYLGPLVIPLVKVWTLRHGTPAQQFLWGTARTLAEQIPALAAGQSNS